MADRQQARLYVLPYVEPYPLPLDVARSEACRQITQDLFMDIRGFNDIILRLPHNVHALRSEALLRSAVERPFTTVDLIWAYPSGLLQAAALFHSLVQNHPFSDGNKRTALYACLYFLESCQYWQYGQGFLSRHEYKALENLVLDVAREGEDVRSGVISERYTADTVARLLDMTLRASRGRKPRLTRATTGLFGWMSQFIGAPLSSMP